MVRFTAQVLTTACKKDHVHTKAPDAFPWDGISEASTADGYGACRTSGDSLATSSEVSEDSLARVSLCALPCASDEPVVIFDWDDSLLPSSFFDFLGTLPSNGRHAKQVEMHAKQVESVLRAARSLGRVAIVTMSNRRWLVKSAQRYLPGLDIEALAAELDMPLVFASDYSAKFAHLPSFEAAVACKSIAMASCLEDLGVIEASVGKPANVVSVGDSHIEHEALRSVFATWGETGRLAVKPLLKTVKFVGSPTLTQLNTELEHLEERLSAIVHHTSGFHLATTSAGEFEEEAWERILHTVSI